MDDFVEPLFFDGTWWIRLPARQRLLDENRPRQQAFWPVSGFIGAKRYVACPSRGTHETLVECWMCWGDVTCGHTTMEQVLRSGTLGPDLRVA
jgi:hypothetical protein